MEVTTPLLSAETVVDEYLDPLQVTLFPDPKAPHEGRVCYLQTSPEFHMKRLLAAGGQAIYQITQAFRAAERGPLHNVEFTIAEWYRVGITMAAGMELLAELMTQLRGCPPAEFVTYAEAFQKYAGLDPHTADRETLVAAIEKREADELAGDTRDELLDQILSTNVTPRLGVERPVIVYDYPASQAALAEIDEGPPRVAKRFELFLRGIELANGYQELLDPAVLRRRNHEVNARRSRNGKPELPTESRLLDAMESGLPACVGVALGFDRLAMLDVGGKEISAVMPFPVERA